MAEKTSKLQELEDKAKALEAEVEAWFSEHIHNSPVSHVTPAFNHVREAVNHLKTRLRNFLSNL